MGESGLGLRVGVYIDIENVSRNGGRGMRFDVLREWSCRERGSALRLNAYLAYDDERARGDAEYRDRASNFQNALRDAGFKVYRKAVRWFLDEEGTRTSKANTDLDMAVDMLLQSERLERVLLLTGDGDFAQVVRALQNRGCRVEVVAFQNVATALRQEADQFVSGYLVPGLLPFAAPASSAGASAGESRKWGEIGSRVRGVCYHYNPEKKYGFFRYLRTHEGNPAETDTRGRTTPYGSAFFHVTALPPSVPPEELPSRDYVFEFQLVAGKENGELATSDIRLAYRYASL